MVPRLCILFLLAGAVLAPWRGLGEDAPKPATASTFQGIIARQEGALEKALGWLAKSQQKDGSWASNGPDGTYRMAMTGLAGLAFLSCGHTPGRGPFGKHVLKAVEFVLKHQQKDGLITSGDDGQSMYGHGFAMTFLGEALGMDPNGELAAKMKTCLTAAVKLTARAQSSWGGWYYSPNSGSDEGSVTITQVQALRSCANAGIPVPPKVMTQALSYIHKSQNVDGGIRYTAQSGGPSSLALSAAGAELLLMAGQYDAKETKKAIEYVKGNLSKGSTQGHDFYTNFYASQAMLQVGGKPWEDYYSSLRNRLITSQGSNGAWSGDVGATYCTSIAVMILALPYNYMPIFQK